MLLDKTIHYVMAILNKKPHLFVLPKSLNKLRGKQEGKHRVYKTA
jgi:hypothetical protein